MRSSGALLVLCAMTGVAAADEPALYERLWPEVPTARRLTLSQQITDQLTTLGNTLGQHLDVLSNDLVALRFDGRRRLARIRVGLDERASYLKLRVAGDVHFTQGVARVSARLDLGIGDHVLALELPDVEMAPASYRDERGVEIRLPLFRQAF